MEHTPEVGGRQAQVSKVLVVDDDPALAEMLGIVLRQEGLEAAFVADGDAALGAFRRERPDLVLLDLMLPGTDGIEVCRQIRAESGVAIVMLTARSDTLDVVLGLESGADDYVVKPFKPKELVARLRARLRTREDEAPETLTIGPTDDLVTIDVPGHKVVRDGAQVQLTPLEFDLLVALARKPHTGLHPRGPARAGVELPARGRHALVNVHVQRLRAKVERDPERPQVVITVRGVGYKAGPA
jgi:two-component system response regulator MtrA